MTLVETVIALFIAVFLIAAILTSVVFASRIFAEAKALTNATNIINEEVENLRSLTFSELKTELNVPTSGSSVLSPTTPKILHVGHQEFSVSRSSCFVTNKIPAGGGTPTVNESLIGTTITVSWVVMQKPHHASSTTSFSEYGYAAKL